ncbi:MAG TPA: FHA domain-containing protein [Myxococcota bacterium]|nr:FHA domain-containing protein [Myxococcota bacterium]
MAIKLVIEALEEALGISQYDLDQSVITVGRSKSCHIELDHPEVSRRHFIVKFIDDAYVLLDEDSRHGTIVDGVKLEPYQNHVLHGEHVVEVPGFLLRLYWDGQRPKLERTTVVARKLLDELLQDEVGPRQCPRLILESRGYDFRFIEKKTSFVLGRLLGVDFSVDDEGVAKEHVSFVRDIYGVRINPLPGHEVLVNRRPIADPQILAHNDVIKVGNLDFLFKAREEDPDAAGHPEKIEPQGFVVKEEPSVIHRAPAAQEPSPQRAAPFVIRILDRFFVLAFFLVLAGASAIFFSLI